MKGITFLTILVCISSIKCARRRYILTIFNDIQKYALKMVQHPDMDPRDMVYTKDASARYNLCKNLLAAPIFEISSEVNPFNRVVDRGYHNIDLNAWIQLKTLCYSSSSFQNRLCTIASHNFSFPFYTCVNHDSRFTWLASYGNGQKTGFIFTTVPANSIYALVDLTAMMMVLGFNTTMDNDFMKSISKADPPHSESLCYLKKISQLRLCAICADSLHRKTVLFNNDSLDYFVVDAVNPDTEIYADPYFNYYNDTHYEKNEHCPHTTVTMVNEMRISAVYVAALYCDIKMKGVKYQFFLKRNLNDKIKKDSIYIIENGTIKGRTNVKQLHNILTMDAYL